MRRGVRPPNGNPSSVVGRGRTFEAMSLVMEKREPSQGGVRSRSRFLCGSGVKTMSGHAVLTAQKVEDCIIDQGWERYSAEDHAIWRVLFERQQQTLKGHVCQEYLDGLA